MLLEFFGIPIYRIMESQSMYNGAVQLNTYLQIGLRMQRDSTIANWLETPIYIIDSDKTVPRHMHHTSI